jgi:peptidyl-prolyl cis-trans isomerase B (cyclophilin B)
MPKSYTAAPAQTIDASKKYTATFSTAKGDVVVELFADRAPVTVNNFVFLANEGFYNGTVFHRVINDFMVQGGDPTGTGRGGPGYKWPDEKAALAIPHERGSLSMANAGPNTNGSQFFITHIVTDWLDGKHAVFGRVVSGQDVVDSIKQNDLLAKVTVNVA